MKAISLIMQEDVYEVLKQLSNREGNDIRMQMEKIIGEKLLDASIENPFNVNHVMASDTIDPEQSDGSCSEDEELMYILMNDIVDGVNLYSEDSNAGKDGHFRWSPFDWFMVNRLASHYGWKPIGPHNHMRTIFSYIYVIERRIVVLPSEDSITLANALEKALPDIPDTKVTCNIRANDNMPKKLNYLLKKLYPKITEPVVPAILGISLTKYFSGEAKDRLIEFIAFCHHGSFSIEDQNV